MQGKWKSETVYSCAAVILVHLSYPVGGSEGEEEAFELPELNIPIVLTPSQLPQRLDESPSTVTIIDREMIEASGARDLLQVLRLVPGFYVGTKDNHLPTAGYHGLADEFSRRMLLLVDGQRIFQYSRGIIQWNLIPVPLENIARIEVVRGPNAAAYGSNAFQAVINIQTRNPAEDRGFYLRGTVGNDAILDGFFRYGGRIGSMDYALSLFRQGDSGYDPLKDSRREYGATLVGELPVGKMGGSLNFRAGYERGEYEAGDDPPGESIEAGEGTKEFEFREFPAVELYQALKYRQPIGDTGEITATLAHGVTDFRDRGYRSDRLLPGVNLKVQFDNKEERYDAELKYSRIVGDRFRIVTGGGYHYEEVKAPFYFDTDDKLDNRLFRLYAHGEYKPSDRFVFNVGAMWEKADISATDGLFLPRLSAHYHLDGQQTIRAMYSTGSRQPVLYESEGRAVVRAQERPLTLYRVFATGGDRGGLKPEYIQSFELGYQWIPNKSTHFDVRIFREQISDLIVAYFRENTGLPTVLPNEAVLDFGNEKDMAIQGVEAQFDWRTRQGFRLFTSYAYTDIDAEGTRYNFGYEDSVPRHSFGLLASQEFGHGWEASLLFDYQSAMQWYLDDPIDRYKKLTVRVAKQFTVGRRRGKAELIGTHLMEPVSDYRPDQKWDRGIMFRVSLEF